MAQQRLVAEFIERRTKAGDPYFVAHVANPDGGWTRLVLFHSEARTNDAGEAVPVWQLRAEEVLARPGRFEQAPPRSRRIGASRDQRPQTAARPEGRPTDRA